MSIGTVVKSVAMIAAVFILGRLLGKVVEGSHDDGPLTPAPFAVSIGERLPRAVVHHGADDSRLLAELVDAEVPTVFAVYLTACSSCRVEALEWDHLSEVLRDRKRFIVVACSNDLDAVARAESSLGGDTDIWTCDDLFLQHLNMNGRRSPAFFEVSNHGDVLFVSVGPGATEHFVHYDSSTISSVSVYGQQ